MDTERHPFRRRLMTRARRLRREMTEPERRLWYALRDRRLAGWKFRRQQVIGPYILDFYCPAASLALEIDGESHADRGAEDLARQSWLIARGVRVVRLTNDEVLRDLPGVIEALVHVLGPRK
jgi:very-short-patch-repair endonuclease